MSFAYRPDFCTTFAASFETLKDGGIHITVDDDGVSASTDLTRQEAQALHDLLAKHLAKTAT